MLKCKTVLYWPSRKQTGPQIVSINLACNLTSCFLQAHHQMEPTFQVSDLLCRTDLLQDYSYRWVSRWLFYRCLYSMLAQVVTVTSLLTVESALRSGLGEIWWGVGWFVGVWWIKLRPQPELEVKEIRRSSTQDSYMSSPVPVVSFMAPSCSFLFKYTRK